MAKYTELLSEYLASGGELPAAFAQIEGFEDLFVAEYIDREIGYETPELFKIKLELLANLVIPPYLARITALENVSNKIIAPNKKRVRTGNTERTRGGQIINATTNGTPDARETTVKTYDLPTAGTLDPANQWGAPSQVNITTEQMTENTESYKDYKENENYNNITDSEEGLTSSEALAIKEAYEKEIINLKVQLLKEFNTCFMVIF